MKNNGWIGFIAGALVGAGIAWLFTSKEGKELLEKVNDKGGDLKDKAEKEWSALKQEVEQLKNDISAQKQ
jgi:gas vesicle protein